MATPSTSRTGSASKTAESPVVVKETGPVVEETDGPTSPELTAGQSVEETKNAPEGYAGLHGFELISGEPTKESKKSARERARVFAPHLTDEFISAFKISDETVADIADQREPAPPVIGPNYTGDLYLTPGGWVHTKPGVSPGESTAISR